MPTGYTAIVSEKDDVTFREFALQCARAFGACIMQRDDPISSEIVFDKPSDYHQKAVAEAYDLVAKLRQMTPQQVTQAYADELAKLESEMAEACRKDAAIESRYRKMLAAVEKWNPPSEEHNELKKFMTSQLNESIRFDCGSEYYVNAVKQLKGTSPEEWHAERLRKANADVHYHEKKHGEELSRTASRNLWKRQLIDSLG